MVEQIVKAAEQENAARVLRIVVVIGAYSGVESEAFEFAFPFASENTLAEGAELILEHVPAHALCNRCGSEFSPRPPQMACEKCGSDQITLQGGREFLIRTVDLEIP